MELAVEVMASKKCSHHCCKRMHTTTFKTCPTCRTIRRNFKKKRRRLAAEQIIPDGHKFCRTCLRIQSEDQFKSYVARRKKLNAMCRNCLSIQLRTQMNPETLTGQCRQVWLDWKKDKTCNHCGSSEAIEADHLRGKRDVDSDYVHVCSDYHWWAWNEGPEAQKRELAKCQPLCRPCHRLKSKKERGVQTKPCILRHQKIVNDEKLRVGACECGCERKVTPENVCTFDWAHKDRETRTIHISHLVYKTKGYFQKQWPLERAKCRLLHSICHKAETAEENKRKNKFKSLVLF